MPSIDSLFPEAGKFLLAGSGKEFIERLGIDAARQVILAVLRGENIRGQTEPLTRRRVAIATGAMVALFARGWRDVDGFTDKLSQMALEQMSSSSPSNKALVWPAQWLVGLTGKAVQNVLRSNLEARIQYIEDFETAVAEAAARCEADFGPVRMTVGFANELGAGSKVLNWTDITRLTTAIGCATLTIRGSEKSTYGKLFERLVLGTALTILGFTQVPNSNSPQIDRVFWLSDSSDVRECDATIRLRAGKLARFDIGFIGKGNPEIMKDKLTRYANEVKTFGRKSTSQTFVIVDKMPQTTKTVQAAQIAGSEIVQMSMQYWPKELAKRLRSRLKYESEIENIADTDLDDYLAMKIATIPILNLLSSNIPPIDDLMAETADEEALDL